MLLILSSNVIWHAYKLIAETKIFRIAVSLVCLLFVKEERTGKKVYYRKICKDIYYFKYREISCIFTINDHNISDSSIQISIKFAFTVYVYISYYPIWYTYIYIYKYIYTLYTYYIYIYTLHIYYIYMYINFFNIACFTLIYITCFTLVVHTHNLFQLVLLDHCH